MTPDPGAGRSRGADAPEGRGRLSGGGPPADGRELAPLVESVEVTIDAVDSERAVGFWCAALGYEERYRRGAFVVLGPAGARTGPTVLVQRLLGGAVTAGARGIHLDLRSSDPSALVGRLEGLGARAVRAVEDEGRSWVVMEDPEGVRFCVCEARGAHGAPGTLAGRPSPQGAAG